MKKNIAKSKKFKELKRRSGKSAMEIAKATKYSISTIYNLSSNRNIPKRFDEIIKFLIKSIERKEGFEKKLRDLKFPDEEEGMKEIKNKESLGKFLLKMLIIAVLLTGILSLLS